jgi:Sulfotransferase family
VTSSPAVAYMRSRMPRRDEQMTETDEIAQGSRFFFVHVQKTAGTALFRRLRRHFGKRSVYPDASDGDVVTVMPQLSVDILRERWRDRRDEIRVVTGHFPLCTTELLGERFTTLTVLREPVERTLSYLRHHRMLTQEDRDKPLEAIYEDEFRYQALIHNHMVKMFSLTPSEMTDGALTPVEFTPDHLDRAKQQLATVDLVGLQVRFEEFCENLQHRLGWNLGAPLRANRTEPVEVSRSFRDRIAQDNSMDVELYAHAERLYEERRTAGVGT